MDSIPQIQTSAAYTWLRRAVLETRFKAGDRLTTQSLADAIGVSRTPVKEALARLESEGLVVRPDRWGYRVREISVRDAEDIFEARVVVEVANARLCAERCDADQLAGMREALGASQAELTRKRLVQFQHRARAVHERISRGAGNVQLDRMFRQVNDLVILFGVSLLQARPGRAAEIQQENEAIVNALSVGDGHLSARLMHDHICRGHETFRAMLASDRPALSIGYADEGRTR